MARRFAPLLQVSEIGIEHKLRGTENVFDLAARLVDTSVKRLKLVLAVGSDSFNDWGNTYLAFYDRHARSKVSYEVFIVTRVGITPDAKVKTRLERKGIKVSVDRRRISGLSSTALKKTGLDLLPHTVRTIFAEEQIRDEPIKAMLIATAALIRWTTPSGWSDYRDLVRRLQPYLEPALVESGGQLTDHVRDCLNQACERLSNRMHVRQMRREPGEPLRVDFSIRLNGMASVVRSCVGVANAVQARGERVRFGGREYDVAVFDLHGVEQSQRASPIANDL